LPVILPVRFLVAPPGACHAAGAADDAHCAWAEAREVFRRLRNEPAAATATSLLGRAAPG
jgi:hypothetical protein